MAVYRYRALGPDGLLAEGEMEAASESAVVRSLQSIGQYPISAKTTGKNSALSSLWPRKKRVSKRELSVVTAELATLLRAGLELDRALVILQGLGESKPLHASFTGILSRVRDGSSFSEAVAADDTFPTLYVSMIRAGEFSGRLDASVESLAVYLERTQTLRESVKSALIYPAILFVVSGLSIAGILVFVLPQFEPLFAEAGKSLPLATRIVISAGHFVGSFWWAILLLFAGAAALIERSLRQEPIRHKVDALALGIPILGDLWRKIEIERFARTLGVLLMNGVALTEGLRLTKNALSNRVLAAAVDRTASNLREGEALADNLARSKVFTPMVVDLVRVGEESGRLGEMLLRQADIYEQNVKHALARLLALLVPVLTILSGLIVAGLIASMLLAVLSINDLAL